VTQPTVTDADREAAHKFIVGSMSWWDAKPVLAGEKDNHPLVQAFAAPIERDSWCITARAVIPIAQASIIAERDAALAKLAAAEEALRKYGRHLRHCDKESAWGERNPRCNCGYFAALATEKNDDDSV